MTKTDAKPPTYTHTHTHTHTHAHTSEKGDHYFRIDFIPHIHLFFILLSFVYSYFSRRSLYSQSSLTLSLPFLLLKKMSSTTATSSLSGATTELFQMWCRWCWMEKEEGNLQAEAATFFASLVGPTEVQIDGGKVLQTKGSHEQALAVLIQTMTPIWSNENNKGATEGGETSVKKEVPGLKARQRALTCLKVPWKAARWHV